MISQFFHEFQQHLVFPMRASITFDDRVVTFMSKQKVLTLGLADETMELLNPEILREMNGYLPT
ncbi:MAG: hypothetical protein N2035_03055 [Chthoniobacterales bacterium]|nr:hypothetical protein [Chthoniobacterales bacterium]